jgi:hypothetical protein
VSIHIFGGSRNGQKRQRHWGRAADSWYFASAQSAVRKKSRALEFHLRERAFAEKRRESN